MKNLCKSPGNNQQNQRPKHHQCKMHVQMNHSVFRVKSVDPIMLGRNQKRNHALQRGQVVLVSGRQLEPFGHQPVVRRTVQ